MTPASQPDFFRPLTWLALVAFCLGFVGYLAVGGATPRASAPHFAAGDSAAAVAQAGG